MIESNINNVAASSIRQDVRSVQGQREANSKVVAEQASSNPMASSGVEAADAARTAVASQPAGIITRLGETTEQVPLYEANRPAGSIIRPAIEIAAGARQTPTISSSEVSEQDAIERETLATSEAVQASAEGAVGGNDTSFNDLQKSV